MISNVILLLIIINLYLYINANECLSSSKLFHIRLFKNKSFVKGWEGAFYTILKVNDANIILHRDSFQDDGLIETHSICLEPDNYYISLTAPSKNIEIGLEICNNFMLKSYEMIEISINKEFQCYEIKKYQADMYTDLKVDNSTNSHTSNT